MVQSYHVIGLKTSSLWVTLIPIPGLYSQSTYNHFLWVGWFLAKNLINFESQLKKPQNQTDESKQWRITWDSLVKLRINTTVSSFLYPILWLDFNRRSKYNVNCWKPADIEESIFLYLYLRKRNLPIVLSSSGRYLNIFFKYP